MIAAFLNEFRSLFCVIIFMIFRLKDFATRAIEGFFVKWYRSKNVAFSRRERSYNRAWLHHIQKLHSWSRQSPVGVNVKEAKREREREKILRERERERVKARERDSMKEIWTERMRGRKNVKHVQRDSESNREEERESV
jgi:hypothetical protein